MAYVEVNFNRIYFIGSTVKGKIYLVKTKGKNVFIGKSINGDKTNPSENEKVSVAHGDYTDDYEQEERDSLEEMMTDHYKNKLRSSKSSDYNLDTKEGEKRYMYG